MLVRILLAADPAASKKRLRRIVREVEDTSCKVLRGRPPRWESILRETGDILLVSRSIIPDDTQDGLARLASIPDAPRPIAVTEFGDAADQARLLASGCLAVLNEGLDDRAFRDALSGMISTFREEALARQKLPRAVGEPRLGDFVSTSMAMQAFMNVVHRVAQTDATLMILGETGVGKERLAQAIHAEGPRSEGPFIPINCGAIPESLLESELFGHEAGAFTGASRARRGWFELAHRGTIFLDEIAEMPFHLQVKLLRVLQSSEVFPIGSEKPLLVDVRVMAATNRDLEEEVREKRFRQDLFYRLSVVSLEIPPLRERKEDIPELVDRYVQYFQSRFPTTVASVSKEALEALVDYSWPGNVRELVNVIERAMLLCPAPQITAGDIPAVIRGDTARRPASTDSAVPWGDPEWTRRPFREVRREWIDRLEKRYLRDLLTETAGRIDETAERAGINPRNLFEKMRRHELRKEDFRKPSRSP